jgi:hypothetical protein
MEIFYTATPKLSPESGLVGQRCYITWEGYRSCFGMDHLTEVITLDTMIGSGIIERDNDLDSAFLLWESFVPDLYTSLDYVLSKIQDKDPSSYNVLAVTKEPSVPCESLDIEGFEFVGYDLMDVYGDISSLTNCTGFENTIQPEDVNTFGLGQTYDRAYELQEDLVKDNPDHSHASCFVWAIWRRK